MSWVTTIEVGANRATLLKLAADIVATFSDEAGERDLTVYGRLNGGTGEEVQIRISNDDMEDRDDLKPDDVFVEIERSNW